MSTYMARIDGSPQPWTFVTAVHYHCFICLSALLHSSLCILSYPSFASPHVTLLDISSSHLIITSFLFTSPHLITAVPLHPLRRHSFSAILSSALLYSLTLSLFPSVPPWHPSCLPSPSVPSYLMHCPSMCSPSPSLLSLAPALPFDLSPCPLLPSLLRSIPLSPVLFFGGLSKRTQWIMVIS